MAVTVKKVTEPVISTEEEVIGGSGRDARIAELAYYKAEKRGFEPGYELDDWYEAEQEFTL